MNRKFWLVVVLVLTVGCQNDVEPQQSEDSSSSVPAASTNNVSHQQVDANQCEEWKTSATFVLVKLSLGSQLLRDDAGYAMLAGPDVPEISKVDPAEIREHLQKLKNLPAPGAASSAPQPSVVLREIEDALQLMEANFAAKTPFANGSGDGQRLADKLLDLYLKGAMSFSEAARECGCSF